MSGTTPTQSLQYPTGGDSIKAAGEAVKSLAERTDARLDYQDAALTVSQVPPITIIESRVAQALTRGFDPWPFDTVLIDTQGGANLSEDPRRIWLRRTGYWVVGGYLDCLTAPGAISTALVLELNTNNPSSISYENANNSQYDGGLGSHASCSTIARVSDASNSYVHLSGNVPGSYNSGFPNTVTCTFRRLWAYWVADL